MQHEAALNAEWKTGCFKKSTLVHVNPATLLVAHMVSWDAGGVAGIAVAVPALRLINMVLCQLTD